MYVHLLGMEASGIAVDIGVLKMYNQIITKRMNEVEKEAHSVCGHIPVCMWVGVSTCGWVYLYVGGHRCILVHTSAY